MTVGIFEWVCAVPYNVCEPQILLDYCSLAPDSIAVLHKHSILLSKYLPKSLLLPVNNTQMKHQPAPGWLYSFMLAAYRQLDMFDAGQLGVVFEALPRVSPHPSWLDEVRVACVCLCALISQSAYQWSLSRPSQAASFV